MTRPRALSEYLLEQPLFLSNLELSEKLNADAVFSRKC